MLRVVLRRTHDSAASVAEAEVVVTQAGARVIDRSDQTMLIEVLGHNAAVALRGGLQGWIVSEQNSRISVPDTRLKARSDG